MNQLPLDPAAWLAAIVESSDDAIVSKTVNGIITSWNASATRLYGYTAEEAIGQSIMLIVPPERQNEEHGILDLIAAGQRVEHFETERRAKNGRDIAVSLTISPVRDASGCIVGASKVARDITERKAAEAALLNASRRKDEFLAMLGHELRNPLAPIQAAVAILDQKTRAMPEIQQLCGVLNRQVRHITRLLDDLLDLGRITSGKIQLRLEPTDLRAVVSRAIETARPAVDAGVHALSVSLPGVPVWVQADATRLVQMLANLIHNAAKYTQTGGALAVSLDTTAAGEARLSVSDNGTGIRADRLPEIFELFVQGESTLDRAQGGLGIGLTLVRSVASLHGGRVEAFSAGEGCGSKFSVMLPLREEAVEPVSAPSGAPVATNREQRRFVVVDDNTDAALMLAEMLRMFGHEADVASEGEAGLALILKLLPNAALVDIGLPGISGHAIARALRDAGYRGTLVAVTGYGQPHDVERSRAAGFDHHWTKPVSVEQISSLAAMPA
jgi:PAS domain S-box-containing protein